MKQIKINKYVKYLRGFGDIKEETIKNICEKIYSKKENDDFFCKGLEVFGL